MISHSKLFAGLVFSALFTGSAFAGQLRFTGNASIPSEALYGAKVSLSDGEGGLTPDPRGKVYRLSEIDATKLAPASISAILRKVSKLYQEKGILATRAVVRIPFS